MSLFLENILYFVKKHTMKVDYKTNKTSVK